ncbi:MAG: ATP-binding protein [Elainellaceae cyanobacterium]
MPSFDPMFRYTLSTSLFQNLRDSFHQLAGPNLSHPRRYLVTESSLTLNRSAVNNVDYFSVIVSDGLSAALVAQRVSSNLQSHETDLERCAVNLLDEIATSQFVDWLVEQLPPGSEHLPMVQQMQQTIRQTAQNQAAQNLVVPLLLEKLSHIERRFAAKIVQASQNTTASAYYEKPSSAALLWHSHLNRSPNQRLVNATDAYERLTIDDPQSGAPEPISAAPCVSAAVGRVSEQAEVAQAKVSQAEVEYMTVEHAKNKFLAAINHELRTPLTYILGMSTTLLRWIDNGADAALQQQQRHYLESIYNQGKHLLEMINSILDLSQSEVGQMSLDIQKVSLSALLQQCLRDYQAEADRRQIDLVLETGLVPHQESTAADPHRLRQVIAILLSNALKFTAAGGRVTVRLSLSETEVKIQVQDTGIGIAEKHRSVIFRKFKQLDDSYHRQYEGTGMGLALAKQLVELHHGSIHCDSTVDVGTIFTVRLPRVSSINGPEPNLSTGDRAGHRILLVDSLSQSAQAIADSAAAAGYQVIWVLEGCHAAEQVDALQPDVVIVGTQVADMDSRELIHQLRQTQSAAELKIAAVDDGRDGSGMVPQRRYSNLAVNWILKSPKDLSPIIDGLSSKL